MFIKGLTVIPLWNNDLGVLSYLFLKEHKILIKPNR